MTGRAAVLAAYLRARRRRFVDREALQVWQDARVADLLARAPGRYPFYRGLAPRQLADLPVIDKATVVSRFSDLNDRGLDLQACLAVARAAEADRDFTATLGGVSIGLSSGTSGRQSVFLTSPAERARWAGEILARVLPGGLLAGARVALVLRAGGPLYESVGSGRIAFRFFDLARPVDEHIDGMARFSPTVLAAPPPVLRALAAAHAAGSLPIAPGRIFSVAEVLDPHDRAAVETSFGVRVDEIYQATEGFLGISCMHGRLHLNEDLLVIEREPLDSSGRRFVPVVTDLFRTSQAVIRWRLDDVLLASTDACPCGSPTQVVDAVEGRCDDVLLLPRGGYALAPFYADFVRGAVLSAPGVADFRVVQPAPRTLRLAVEPTAAWSGARDSLVGAITAAGLTAPEILPATVPTRAPLEKLRRVVREFPAPSAGGAAPQQPRR